MSPAWAGAFTHSAAVVDESRQVATLGGIDDGVVVHSEQVAAPDALLCVPLLAIVGHHLDTRSANIRCMRGVSRVCVLFRKQISTEGQQYLSDVLTHILNDHFISSDRLHGEQAPLVDPAAPKTKLLLTKLHTRENAHEPVSAKGAD